MQSSYQLVPIEHLKPGRYQPRQSFDDASLQALAQSIKAQGLLEPLLVRASTAPYYEIIAGERRWRALMLANVALVPCLIGQYTDQQAAAVRLVENIQREDLNLIEEAQGYQRLMGEFHFHQHEIAAMVGKSRSHIANLTRLLTLSDPVQQWLREKKLSLGHARMLVGLASYDQRAWAHQVITKHWSVRQLEHAIRNASTSRTPLSTPDHDSLQNRLADYMGAPVKIVPEHDNSGWITIKYFDHDTLSGLLERIGLPYEED